MATRDLQPPEGDARHLQPPERGMDAAPATAFRRYPALRASRILT
jgi:hypothetical protein